MVERVNDSFQFHCQTAWERTLPLTRPRGMETKRNISDAVSLGRPQESSLSSHWTNVTSLY